MFDLGSSYVINIITLIFITFIEIIICHPALFQPPPTPTPRAFNLESHVQNNLESFAKYVPLFGLYQNNIFRMDEYLKNGEEIFNKYCRSADSRPVMFPKAPQQTYIDVYPDGPGSSSTFVDDKQRQSDYEAEVLVYRALEMLKEPMIVLHGFTYTHHQYRLCDKNHVRKGCNMCKGKNATNIDGECDFLIIYRGMFVIIEVKNVIPVFECEPDFHLCMIGEDIDRPECGAKNGLVLEINGTLSKSLRQRERVEKLITSLDEDLKVLTFTAYPNLSKIYIGKFHLENLRLRNSIIFKEDISDFATWWHRHTNALLSPVPAYNFTYSKKSRNMLLACWCTDQNVCDLQKCSLGWCIKDIDEKLRTGKFVFRKNNPLNVRAPEVIKESLYVENLTKQQYDVFNTEKRFLWILGPAGTGKSVILAGRIIQQVHSNDSNRVVLFRFGGNSNRIYQQALDKENVEYSEINPDSFKELDLDTVFEEVSRTQFRINGAEIDEKEDEFVDLCNFVKHAHKSAQLSKLIPGSTKKNKVTIVNLKAGSVPNFPLLWLIDNISELSKECSIFIDDIQTMLSDASPYDNIKRFFFALSQSISSRNIVYVACDVGQSRFKFYNYSQDFHQCLINELASSPFHVVSLSKNLRNTYNIARVLSVMRNLAINLNKVEKDESIFLPEQALGHYIHGPKVKVNVLNNFKQIDVTEFLRHELHLLCNEEAFETSDIGLLHDFYQASKTNWSFPIFYALCTLPHEIITKDIVKLCTIDNSPSAEFPAVIVFHEMNKNRYSDHIDDLRVLYQAVSRARVYCSIILFPEKDTSVEDHEIYSRMLEKLCDAAHIIRHYTT